MKTLSNQTSEAPANIVSFIPDDLAVWLNDATLAAAARESAEIFYWIEAGEDDDHPPFGGCACPLRKLTLFTYCCARGIYATEDIAAGLAGETFPASSTLRELAAGAAFPSDKLLLFRSHNSELIKLCLARVLEQAWTAKLGTAPRRDYLAAEADRRLELACRADAPSRSSRREEVQFKCEVLSVNFQGNQSLVTSAATRNRFTAAACVFLVFLLTAFASRAAEVLPNFTHDGKAYTNATVIEANPVDILIRQEATGFTRIQRQDLPAELKARFPYDSTAAAAYEKEKAAKAAALRDQGRANTLAALQRQQAELQAGIYAVERQLAALQRELDVLNVSARGKPNSAARQQADRYRLIKQDHIRHADQLRDQLEQVRTRQSQFR